MSIKKIWGTRTKANAATYVGERGTIFYNEVDGELRLSDGVTPGGVAISVRADLIVAQRLTPALDNNNAYGLGDETHRWWDLHVGDGGIHYNGFADPQYVPYRPGAQVDDIIPALDNNIDLGNADHRFANLYLGTQGLFLADTITDANINIVATDGTLYLNGVQNLRLGNLAIRDTTLTSATNDLDISIGATDDTGFFYVKRKAQFDNTTWSDTEAMVSINGSGGADPLTNFADTLVQATGRPNKSSRIVQRAYGSDPLVPANNSYAVWASYAARGTVASPEALQAGDILSRFSSNGLGKTGGTSVWGSGGTRIESVALENFTATAKGSKINFYTTPVGQLSSQNVAAITSDGMLAKAMEFQADLDLANGKVQQKAGIEWDQKGAVNGIASLDNNGKLTTAQIPDVLTGAIVFKGVWNATTNVPALSDTTPAGLITGWEYIVEVGGTRDIGDGSKVFVNGDFVIFDGTHWKQVPSGNLFTSLNSGGHITVNQTTGTMTLGSDATSSSTNNTIVARDSSGNFAANVITANLTGTVTGSVSGNAGSVTNGFYTSSSFNLGTTSIAVNRASASQTLTGVSIDGNAGTATNGVVTTGSYSDPSWLTISKSKVGLGNVDNTADANKNVLYATTAGGAPATDVYAWAKAATKPAYTATEVGLGNVTNESKATMFTSPTFTGTVVGVTATMVGLGNVTNESKATMFTSPTFTGTVAGVTKTMVGLSAVENTALSTWAGSSNITTAGTLTTTSVSDSIGNLRSIPINGKSAAYILAATDNGQMISITTGGVTVNSGIFASPYGQTVSIYNNSASSQTITQGAGVTLRLAGTTATGNRTLARYGVATIVCVAANTFVMSGAGVS